MKNFRFLEIQAIIKWIKKSCNDSGGRWSGSKCCHDWEVGALSGSTIRVLSCFCPNFPDMTFYDYEAIQTEIDCEPGHRHRCGQTTDSLCRQILESVQCPFAVWILSWFSVLCLSARSDKDKTELSELLLSLFADVCHGLRTFLVISVGIINFRFKSLILKLFIWVCFQLLELLIWTKQINKLKNWWKLRKFIQNA